VASRTRRSFDYLKDPAHWRGRAEEMRVLAEQMRDPNARRMMLGIALDYDRLGDWSEKQMLQDQNSSPPTIPSSNSFLR